MITIRELMLQRLTEELKDYPCNLQTMDTHRGEWIIYATYIGYKTELVLPPVSKKIDISGMSPGKIPAHIEDSVENFVCYVKEETNAFSNLKKYLNFLNLDFIPIHLDHETGTSSAFILEILKTEHRSIYCIISSDILNSKNGINFSVSIICNNNDFRERGWHKYKTLNYYTNIYEYTILNLTPNYEEEIRNAYNNMLKFIDNLISSLYVSLLNFRIDLQSP